MKTTIKSFIILFTGLLITGCSKDFLDVEPPSSLTGNSYFRNATDAEASIAAAYKPLQSTGNLAKITEAPLEDIVIFNTQGLIWTHGASMLMMPLLMMSGRMPMKAFFEQI